MLTVHSRIPIYFVIVVAALPGLVLAALHSDQAIITLLSGLVGGVLVAFVLFKVTPYIDHLPVHLNYRLASCCWCQRHKGLDRIWWWLGWRCFVCSGRGIVPVVGTTACRHCAGNGLKFNLFSMTLRCPSCNGSGQAGYIKETDSEYIISWGG